MLADDCRCVNGLKGEDVTDARQTVAGIGEFALIDRLAAAQVARLTAGLSPASLGLAFADWALHLAAAPGKQAELAMKAWRKSSRLAAHAVRSAADPSASPCKYPRPWAC